MNSETIVIGFTGAFGSGCTEAAKHLRDERAFSYLALSSPLRSLWTTENGPGEPKRYECGEPLQRMDGPPWRCESCLQKGEKTNLESFFFPDRAMSWRTAVHAEVAAILAAGERARGGTLYTTTFPCFQCAEKITQVGIKTVYFSEAYPDPHSDKRLELSRVELRQFEGVRSSSIERLFPRPT